MKKKVLFIDNSPWWGGAEACLNTYTKDGSLKDFDVEICFLFPLEHQSQYEASKKTYRYSQCLYFMPEFYNRPIKGLDRLNKYLRAKKLKEILQKSKPDIVYLNLYRNRDIWDIKIIKEYGCKVVFHIRNLYHQAKYNIDILNQADLIIGTSKYVCDEIERHWI
ncbi:hypothetical protein [Photobacterium leiognathi]|uniref:hypothetical protein n=1 Tax=Photobacterium leiognathi TaxID=553611 RepID=UPI0027399BE0|nr:hypothetical protein [Photobacterium leiognathi]